MSAITSPNPIADSRGSSGSGSSNSSSSNSSNSSRKTVKGDGGSGGNGNGGVQEFNAMDEYRSLLRLSDRPAVADSRADYDADDQDPEEVYKRLMSKERRVLDTVDRVVNDSAERRASEMILYKLPIHEIVMRTLGATRALWDDMIEVRTVDDALRALSDKQRMPYIGIMLVAVAVVLAVIQTTV